MTKTRWRLHTFAEAATANQRAGDANSAAGTANVRAGNLEKEAAEARKTTEKLREQNLATETHLSEANLRLEQERIKRLEMEAWLAPREMDQSPGKLSVWFAKTPAYREINTQPGEHRGSMGNSACSVLIFPREPSPGG
jgi:hypothetical protein